MPMTMCTPLVSDSLYIYAYAIIHHDRNGGGARCLRVLALDEALRPPLVFHRCGVAALCGGLSARPSKASDRM